MSDILGAATRRLAEAGIESPRREARILLARILGISSNSLLTTPPRVNAADAVRYEALIERRLSREPLAYIIGEREFWSLPFKVGPGVLIPRPETETLIEQLRTSFPDPNTPLSILDLGTGSGCLLVAALHEYPRAHGMGVDVSSRALKFAAENLGKHGLAKRGRLEENDFSRITGRFDVILSNPPYVPSGEIAGLERDVRDFEPKAALDGGPDGLSAYRLLAGLLPNLLAKGGIAFLEIGQGQETGVSALMEAAGLKIGGIVRDLADIPRCVKIGTPG